VYEHRLMRGVAWKVGCEERSRSAYGGDVDKRARQDRGMKRARAGNTDRERKRGEQGDKTSRKAIWARV